MNGFKSTAKALAATLGGWACICLGAVAVLKATELVCNGDGEEVETEDGEVIEIKEEDITEVEDK